MANEKSAIFSWIKENLQETESSQYVDLIEIKKKCNPSVTNFAVGNVIGKLFKNVKTKSGRARENWCKITKRYYGLTWKKESSNSEVQFQHIPNLIPDGYFVISKSPISVQIGHFTGTIVNGSKVMIELELKLNGDIKLIFMRKEIDLEKIGIQKQIQFTTNGIESLFNIISELSYCVGVKTLEQDLPHFQEQVSSIGDENSDQIRYRSQKCLQILPFKTSNAASPFCYNCKKLKTKVDKNNTETSNADEVILGDSDHNDLSEIFNRIFPDCSPKMQTFLASQKMALERHPFGRRWNKEVIRLCLTLYCRSPRGYSELRNSNFLILPSQNLLRRYKNTVHQEAGININMLQWMSNEAQAKNIPPEGYQGGLIIDEMSIQQDLQFSKTKDNIHLIGFTECTPESVIFQQLKSNKTDRILATHVLQLVFLGFTGYRFPFSHFPSNTASGHELYLIIWKAISMLSTFGFTIQYISTDGAQSNRDLFHILLPEFNSSNPITCSFHNVFSPKLNEKIFFIMDISHTIKKIRNNVSKSGDDPSCKRRLKFNDNFIEWNHFKQAYIWDISTNPFPVHHKLSQEHIYLTPDNKMRNHLAEQVLNEDMLHLMKFYKASQDETGGGLDSTIEFLEQTSVLIKNFKDHRPITDSADERLKQNHNALQWFIQWEKSIKEDTNISNKEKCLISHQTRQDIISSIMGFEELCLYKLRSSNASIIPSRVNSDVIENIFCQQRTLHNGANTNPTYLGYCHTVNSVII